MPIRPDSNINWVEKLVQSPRDAVMGGWSGAGFKASIIAPDFRREVQQHYADIVGNDLLAFCRRSDLDMPFDNFGLQLEFERAAELSLHTAELLIDDNLRKLMDQFGPVIIKNAYLDADIRAPSHRNRFPHLNFHLDRTAKQVTVYSMYTRDPFDAEQKMPRTSSTLFTPNIVAYLQAVKEGLINPDVDKGLRTSYVLFSKEIVGEVFDKLVIEHRWDEPQGTGEISMIDNRTMFHSSYYRDASVKGYKIGVRYLADLETSQAA